MNWRQHELQDYKKEQITLLLEEVYLAVCMSGCVFSQTLNIFYKTAVECAISSQSSSVVAVPEPETCL